MIEHRPWDNSAALAVSWWTDRIVPVVFAVDLVVVVGSLAGFWGSRETVALILGLPVLPGLAVALGYAIRQGRLFPGRRFGRRPEQDRRLAPLLLAGGPVPPAERPMAGRVAWWRLCAHIHTTWNSVGFLGSAVCVLGFDRSGHGHWNVWGVVQVVILVVLLAVHPRVLREGEQWRRIASDPTLVTPPR